MKTNNILTIGLLSTAVLFTGCKDSFLDITPPTADPIDEYFTTDAHVQEAVVAAYDPLEWPDWCLGEYNPVNVMSDIMADDIWVGGADKTDNAYWHLMANYEALPSKCMTGLWTEEYSGVKRCNDVLTYIGWAKSNITEANQKSYEVQARVLRAYYYNNLWKFWGNIPCYMENLTYPYTSPQLSADTVYNRVINDLQGAINMDVLPMKQVDDSLGRVTKAMAYMLYTEMVMYQNDEAKYPTALKYMQEIINSGVYKLYDDYAKIWDESGEWCSESIWEINYMDNNASRDWGNAMAAGGTVLPRLISPYGWTDGIDGVANGWGFCPVRTETYNRYASSDTRRDATCFNASGQTYTKRYEDTGFFLAKYIARPANNADCKGSPDLNFNNNLRIYRYAECLLNAAELLVRTGGSTADASTYLNLVHKRAGLTDDVSPTIDNIIKERQLEFVGEGKRYWDLVRTGKAASTLVPDEYGYRTNSWTSSKKYLPIPQSETDADSNLKQNDY